MAVLILKRIGDKDAQTVSVENAFVKGAFLVAEHPDGKEFVPADVILEATLVFEEEDNPQGQDKKVPEYDQDFGDEGEDDDYPF